MFLIIGGIFTKQQNAFGCDYEKQREERAKKERRYMKFVVWPIRALLFPVFFVIRVVKWVYYLD